MSDFARGMQLGAGMVGLGWGVYRMAQGQRDVVTTASLTAGTSMLLSSMTGEAPVQNLGRVGRTLGTVRNIAAITARVLG